MTDTVHAAQPTTTRSEPPSIPGCRLPPHVDPTMASAGWVAPAGLGRSAARIAAQFVCVGGDDGGYGLRRWGDGTAPPLYCPAVERINDALADEVDAGVRGWARDCGFGAEECDRLGGAGFGRLAMLTHPGTDDPDSLLVAAQLNAAWRAAHDRYADSLNSDHAECGATPTELPPRLALVMAAMDPVAPAGEFTAELDEALRGDPVLVALHAGLAHTARHSTPAQIQRICYATFAMFLTWNAYAAWRVTDDRPPAWEYLAARQHDSCYTSMTLIDIVGRYELTANLFYHPRVRKALMQAGTAAVIVKDLLSVAQDVADERSVCNMVLQIAADRQCSISTATEVAVELHNRLVRDFEETHRALRTAPAPELQRFLRGVRGWLAGGVEWHTSNPRYAS